MPEVEEAPTEVTPEQLAAVINLAREHLRLILLVEKHEEEIRKLNAAIKLSAETVLPEALSAVHLTEMSLGEGWFVKIKPFTSAGITEEHKEEAHAWLENHQMGGLIKRAITILFGRDEEKWAKKFLQDCAQRKKPLNATLKETVNTSTLTATMKEQIAKAQEEGYDPKDKIPFDLFSIYQANRAELVPPKKPKVKL